MLGRLRWATLLSSALYLALFLTWSGPALGEVFLGEEPRADQETPETPASASDLPMQQGVRRGAAPTRGQFAFSGRLTSSKNAIGGRGAVEYAFNRFVASEFSFSYAQSSAGDAESAHFGPDLDMILRLPNPTIVTPYVGAGVGYFRWRRAAADEPVDAGASPTAHLFGGGMIKLTHHFGIQVERRQATYLMAVPETSVTDEAQKTRRVASTNIGFYVHF